MSGYPAELDAGFIASAFRPLQRVEGLITNIVQFERQTEKAASESKQVKGRTGNKTPAGETELYAAPFFNVTRERVCLGSALAEKSTDLSYDGLIKYWERIFWMSKFSHLGGAGNPTKSNLVLVTKASRETPFDDDELKPLNVKLKNLLK